MSSAKGLRYEVLDVFAEAPLAGQPARGRVRRRAPVDAPRCRRSRARRTCPRPRSCCTARRATAPSTCASSRRRASCPTRGTRRWARRSRSARRSAAARSTRWCCASVSAWCAVRFAAGRARLARVAAGALRAVRARRSWRRRRSACRASALHPALPVEVQRRRSTALRSAPRPRAARGGARRARGLREAGRERRARRRSTRSRAARAIRAITSRCACSRRPSACPRIPPTGSAAGWLGAYLVRHRVLGDGAIDVRLEQGHAIARPSLLHVRASAERRRRSAAG